MRFHQLILFMVLSLLSPSQASAGELFRSFDSFGFLVGGDYNMCPLIKAEPKTPGVLRVMVIDTGVDGKIPELRRYIPGRYLVSDHAQDVNGHGTHVSGVVVAHACPKVELLPCRYYGGNGYMNLEHEMRCIQMALDENVDIINFSAGGTDPSEKEKQLIAEFLKNKKHTFVSAAGNDSHDLERIPYYPCSYRMRGQICVGAVDSLGLHLPSSNFADWLTWRLGRNIESFLPTGRRGVMTGTSQACAVETGMLVEAWCSKHR